MRWTQQVREALIGRRVVVYGIGRSYRRVIVGTYLKIRGGVILDKPVDGCTSWNMDALKVVGRR